MESLLVLVLVAAYFRFMAFLFKSHPAWPESIMLALFVTAGYFLGASIS